MRVVGSFIGVASCLESGTPFQFCNVFKLHGYDTNETIYDHMELPLLYKAEGAPDGKHYEYLGQCHSGCSDYEPGLGARACACALN